MSSVTALRVTATLQILLALAAAGNLVQYARGPNCVSSSILLCNYTAYDDIPCLHNEPVPRINNIRVRIDYLLTIETKT